MPLITKKVLVCDRCGSEAEVPRHGIGLDGMILLPDGRMMCRECSGLYLEKVAEQKREMKEFLGFETKWPA